MCVWGGGGGGGGKNNTRKAHVKFTNAIIIKNIHSLLSAYYCLLTYLKTTGCVATV